ncbi:uncharacterized protein LOC106161232 [Lingula anatina]|uniref:Uncharacterized protein LOC106161232 n=1 Tax=Lingula anatina TaxID=7574 RepID=A0A1S3I5Q6_LINAN|nr:uncharacterized protein LOC106161232 [Lingula anatina]|eukprot:XP_013393582.1 uncharacterized protein LOC106161232 [Lingula anatina]
MAASRMCVQSLRVTCRTSNIQALVQIQPPTIANGNYSASFQQLGFGAKGKSKPTAVTLGQSTAFKLPSLDSNKFYKIGILDHHQPSWYEFPTLAHMGSVLEKEAPPLNENDFKGDPMPDEATVRKEAKRIQKIRKRRIRGLHFKKKRKKNGSIVRALRIRKREKQAAKMKEEFAAILESAERFDPWGELQMKTKDFKRLRVKVPSAYKDLYKRIHQVRLQ